LRPRRPAFNLSGQGVIGGGQVGYNFQFAPNWMVGVETDIQGSHLRDSVACVLPCGTPIAIIPGNVVAAAFPVVFSGNSVEHDLRWFGTLRGRVGWVNGPVLLYFTGGLAYGDIERSAAVSGSTINVFGGGGVFNTFAGQFSTSTTRAGWTIGTGLEGKLGGGWSVKAEYLYLDFGSFTDTFNTVFTTGGGAQLGLVAATRTISSDFRDHIFRVGLDYQFGSYYAPVVTK
jgi:outer membrane immunogenic protein